MKLKKEVYINNISKINFHVNGRIYERNVSITISTNELSEKELNLLKRNGNKKIKIILEVEEPILDDVEKKYLRGFIRPFRNRVEYISKRGGNFFPNDFIEIKLKDEGPMPLPYFEAGTMYKGMELNKEYALKELGLWKI